MIQAELCQRQNLERASNDKRYCAIIKQLLQRLIDLKSLTLPKACIECGKMCFGCYHSLYALVQKKDFIEISAGLE